MLKLKTLRYFHEIIEEEKIDIKESNVCIFGHLGIRPEVGIYLQEHGFRNYYLLKSYLQQLGANVIEIDIGGFKGCSEPIDLSKPITDERFLNKFDLLIDCGTGEHIENQCNLFENIFNLLKTNGVAISILPHKIGWKLHCTWHYDFEWFRNFIETFNFQPIDYMITSGAYRVMRLRDMLMYVAYKKTENTVWDRSKFVNPIYDEGGRKEDLERYGGFLRPQPNIS